MPLKVVHSLISVLSSFGARRVGIRVGRNVRLSSAGKYIVHPSSRICLADGVHLARQHVIVAGLNSEIVIGEDARIDEGVRLEAGAGARIVIEAGCFLGHHTSVSSLAEIRIGQDTLIGPYSYVTDHNHGLAKGQHIKHQGCESEPLIIGTDAWLGTGVTLLKGANLGDGAVAAAGAVVTKPIPSYEIWGGVPAKRIGRRE